MALRHCTALYRAVQKMERATVFRQTISRELWELGGYETSHSFLGWGRHFLVRP